MDYHGSTVPFSRKNHQEVKHWSAKLQGKKEDCLPEGFVPELPSVVYPKFPEIKKMKELQVFGRVGQSRDNMLLQSSTGI